MTLSEFAAAAGVSKPAIAKKKIPHSTNSDGSSFYDPEHPAVKTYLNRKPRERRDAARGKHIPKAKRTPAAIPPDTSSDSLPRAPVPPPPKRALVYTTPRRPAPPQPPALSAPAIDWDDLDALKTREQIEKLRLDNQETRGELIPRDGVKHFVGQIASAHASILLPLGGRLSKQVAAELGCTDSVSIIRAEELITSECYQVVGMIKRRLIEYLERIDSGAAVPGEVVGMDGRPI